MDPVLHALLTDRLAHSDLDEAAKQVLELGAGEQRAQPQPVWLKQIAVEGFRGIGPAAALNLEPAPGLTVVVGRNGSGKSSFAEGLELLMTGALKRWEKRPKAWTETWQCLHHEGPTKIAAELVTEGETVTLEQTWPRGAAYTDGGPPEHRWHRALASFRPFLSYAELATMFDTLASLYDALTPVLGLEDLDALLKQISATRLAYDNQRKQVNQARQALTAALDPDDERAALLAGALDDLEALQALLEDTPTYGEDTNELRRVANRLVPGDDEIRAAHEALRVAARAHDDAAKTDAARATQLAALLEQALALRQGDECPVCGATNDWVARATTEAAELKRDAAQMTEAESAVTAARRAVEALGLPNTQHAALAEARQRRAQAAEAQQELNRRDSSWQQLAAQARQWLAQAREVEQRAPTLKALKDAEKWLKGAAEDLRRERFAPISRQAVENWRELRQGSSVDLHEITLGRRRADFDVRADEQSANALGVMSQGELLALSVSVFLPRAGLEESPFRFAVIDDPVQAMDPAKVDGLANVLHKAARTRQIVVFTHDDRLPEAIRRLKLDATMLHVDRRAGSSVAVQTSRSPVQRYLDGARQYALTDRLPQEVQARVVPLFCRSAVEAAAATLHRRRAAQNGTSLQHADEQLEDARTLRETLALALFGDAGRQGEVGNEIRSRFGTVAASLVTELNRGAHGQLDPPTVKRLPDSTRDLIHALMT
jgi:DNA repair exonuclease SbcCD ATPase subunit